ncbi:AMP-dependent synthetase/ligase [Demequina oxidasica]|uniref:AMP-dependent synthetase/ligase n=1 Tax=Demequina oxidasica TaxID=676199 RepID=UPI000A9C59F2|nr:AMP-dependent synthetase/ligase [Demequina oxidasica]
MPADTQPDYAHNIVDEVNAAWERYSDRVLVSHMVDDQWVDLTGRELRQLVDDVAKGLIARGIEPHQSVGIMARTRYEWSVLDFAIWSAGAIPVPIYDTSARSQVDWITSDSDMSVLFVETDAHAALAHKVAADTESPLNDVYVIDHGIIDELVEDGAKVSDATLAERKAAPGQQDLATIVYTSGTTGRPKGVRLSHFAYLRQIRGIQDIAPGVVFQKDGSTVLFLTLAHSLARMIQVVLLASGMRIGYCPDATQLVPMMGSLKPTLVLAVPRVFEKVYAGAEQKAELGGKVKIFRWAAKQAIDYSTALDNPRGPSIALKARHGLADKLVLGKIRDVLGGRATWAVSGSAPLGERLGHFYRGLGLTVLEGYGLTETNAASHVNRPELVKMGTVGPPLPGLESKIANDGEVLMRGETLFDGYHRNPEATAATMKDGWFMTGDLGEEDADGYVRITGRKKEIIVTAGGKNVAPAVIEDRLRAYPLVSQCIVVGDGRPFIGALVTLDEQALPGWLKSKGMEEMSVAEAARDPRVRARVEKAIKRANSVVSRAESVRNFEILEDDFTVEAGTLTPSLKVKREQVLADYADAVERVYARKEPLED